MLGGTYSNRNRYINLAAMPPREVIMQISINANRCEPSPMRKFHPYAMDAEKVKNRTDVRVLSPVTTGELVLSEEYFTKQVFSESIAKYITVKPLQFAYNPARVNIGSLGMNTFEFDGCVSPVYVVFECERDYQYFFESQRG